MAYSSAELLAAMTAAGGLDVPVLRVDGGAAANDWLMQFQADVLGVPVERPDMVETTALGAAGLAGLALGVWGAARSSSAAVVFSGSSPAPPRERGASWWPAWSRAVRAALAWARADARPVPG